jgi:hypothetical protein
MMECLLTKMDANQETMEAVMKTRQEKTNANLKEIIGPGEKR